MSEETKLDGKIKLAPENRKNEFTRNWVEKLKSSNTTPKKVIGALVAGGADLANYQTVTSSEAWNPVLESNDSRVRLSGNDWGSLSFRVEGLKAALEFSLEIRKSKFYGTIPLYMVPYVIFDDEGLVVAAQSAIYIFDDNQVNDLRGLVGLPKIDGDKI